jgi:hypothetical protein
VPGALALCDGDHRKNRRHDRELGDTLELVCLYWIEAINPLPGLLPLVSGDVPIVLTAFSPADG